MTPLRHAWLIAATELRVEWRSRRVSLTMLLLGVLTVLVFAFAGGGEGAGPAVTASGVLADILRVARRNIRRTP